MTQSPHLNWNPARLDVRAFSQAGQTLQDQLPIEQFERLRAEVLAEAATDGAVSWRLEGSMRPDQAGVLVPWLRLEASVTLALSCQRCLGPVATELEVDRWFRFVADEAAAEAEDEDSEEDVLALEPRPDILALLEDELLMELPVVPMHEECPVDVPMQAGEIDEPDAEPVKENPFAKLAALKKPSR